jgi:ElaB/YqjD/DUF883 family membrane-anchored ribosome-binding protein
MTDRPVTPADFQGIRLRGPDAHQLRAWTARAERAIRRRIEDSLRHALAGDLAAAKDRLDELQAQLVREVQDARAAFLRASMVNHMAVTREAEQAARDARILGRDLEADFQALVLKARQLLSASSAAGQGDPEQVAPHVEGWARQSKRYFAALAEQLLGDSQQAIHHATRRVMVEAIHQAKREQTQQ